MALHPEEDTRVLDGNTEGGYRDCPRVDSWGTSRYAGVPRRGHRASTGWEGCPGGDTQQARAGRGAQGMGVTSRGTHLGGEAQEVSDTVACPGGDTQGTWVADKVMHPGGVMQGRGGLRNAITPGGKVGGGSAYPGGDIQRKGGTGMGTHLRGDTQGTGRTGMGTPPNGRWKTGMGTPP